MFNPKQINLINSLYERRPQRMYNDIYTTPIRIYSLNDLITGDSSLKEFPFLSANGSIHTGFSLSELIDILELDSKIKHDQSRQRNGYGATSTYVIHLNENEENKFNLHRYGVFFEENLLLSKEFAKKHGIDVYNGVDINGSDIEDYSKLYELLSKNVEENKFLGFWDTYLPIEIELEIKKHKASIVLPSFSLPLIDNAFLNKIYSKAIEENKTIIIEYAVGKNDLRCNFSDRVYIIHGIGSE